MLADHGEQRKVKWTVVGQPALRWWEEKGITEEPRDWGMQAKCRLTSTAAETSSVLLNCKYFLLTQRNLKLLCTKLKKGLTERFNYFTVATSSESSESLGKGRLPMAFTRCPLTQLYPVVNGSFLFSSWWEESWCFYCFSLDLNNLLPCTPLLIFFFPKAFLSGFSLTKTECFKNEDRVPLLQVTFQCPSSLHIREKGPETNIQLLDGITIEKKKPRYFSLSKAAE